MEKIKVFYDKEGQTLTVWFDDPKKEHICEETGEEVILIKDKEGKVIGFERLNVVLKVEKKGNIPLETITV
ncbi:MAG: DUF2283 domain-containing protein [Dehalococcoidia bacterium]|nr:DUF2283 domain-containing protein [Dehalococcoidia bacterium]